MVSAVNFGATRSPQRRGKAPSYDPLKTQAKLLSDRMYEDAKKIADILAPEVPADQEELPPEDQWLLLELVATRLSPLYWDKPSAIMDLYRLRKQFVPTVQSDYLKIAAQKARRQFDSLPSPDVTPESPEFQKQQRRLED